MPSNGIAASIIFMKSLSTILTYELCFSLLASSTRSSRKYVMFALTFILFSSCFHQHELYNSNRTGNPTRSICSSTQDHRSSSSSRCLRAKATTSSVLSSHGFSARRRFEKKRRSSKGSDMVFLALFFNIIIQLTQAAARLISSSLGPKSGL
jgi:hypothetical protein